GDLLLPRAARLVCGRDDGPARDRSRRCDGLSHVLGERQGRRARRVALSAAVDAAAGREQGHLLAVRLPAPAAVAMVPFGVLPFKLAAVLWLVLQVLAVVVSLRLLGVRDWWCHGAVLGSMAMLNAIGVGAVGPLLLLGVAAAWRYRDRALLAGAIVGAVAVAKLFLWPLGLWLLVTRRYRAAATAIGVALLSTLLAWALIGFAGLRAYPTLLSRLTGLVGPNSYSLYALGRALGLGAAVSQYVPALLAVALVLGARKRSDAAVLTAAVAACLIATPILWTHYLVLLAV